MAAVVRKRLALALSAVLCLAAGLAIAQPAQPKFVEEEPEAASLEGKKAPDFTVTTLDGKKVTLASLKGKVVLLDFWASWCGPCQRSMPHIQQTYAKYKDKGFVVVGVNVDKESDKAKGFLSKIKLNPDYPLALDPNAKVMGSYQVMQMPTAFLIDKKGVVRHKIVGFSDKIGAETDTRIEALLK